MHGPRQRNILEGACGLSNVWSSSVASGIVSMVLSIGFEVAICSAVEL